MCNLMTAPEIISFGGLGSVYNSVVEYLPSMYKAVGSNLALSIRTKGKAHHFHFRGPHSFLAVGDG